MSTQDYILMALAVVSLPFAGLVGAFVGWFLSELFGLIEGNHD